MYVYECIEYENESIFSYDVFINNSRNAYICLIFKTKY